MSKIREVVLSSSDNPFDPFEDYEEWEKFDEQNGYNSLAYLCRQLDTYNVNTNELSDQDYEDLKERAIDDIIELHKNGMYKKCAKVIEEEFVD